MKIYTVSFDVTWIVLIAENLEGVLKLLRTKEDNYFMRNNKLCYEWEYDRDFEENYTDDEDEFVYVDVIEEETVVTEANARILSYESH